MAGGFFTNWAIKEPQVNLFPLDSEPGPFCMLGEHDNHHTTETMCSHQQMVLYPYIPLPSFQSSLGRRSWQILFCFLKNSSSTSSALAFPPHLPWQDNHIQNQNKLFNYKDLFFFLKKDHWEWVYLKGWTPSYIISVNILLQFAEHGGSRYGKFLGVDAIWS